MIDSKTRLKIEDTLMLLEVNINKMDCVLCDIKDLSYDVNKKELEKCYLKIGIIADYMQPVKNDINNILKIIYSCDVSKNAAPNTDQDNEELH